MNKIAVISLSGGMDSTSLLLHLLNKNYTIYALSFNYGQKHILELEKACNNIKYLNKNGYKTHHKTINISDAISLFDSSLTNKNISVPKGYYKETSMKSTVVPNRNSIFLSFTYAYALSLYKKHNTEISLSLGVHSGDHAIYPDCRIEFYKQIFLAFKTGNWNSEHIHLYLPYIDLDKTQILKDALFSCKKLNLDFNEIFKNTLTSYKPDAKGQSNGETGSDIERILAFDKLKIKDPIKYKDSWKDVLKNAKKIEQRYKNDKKK